MTPKSFNERLDKALHQLYFAGLSWHKASLDRRNKVGMEQELEAVEEAKAAIKELLGEVIEDLLKKDEAYGIWIDSYELRNIIGVNKEDK